MKLRIAELAALAIIIVSFVIGFYVYPMLPETIATHWNEQGIVNGTMGKFWGVFLMPLITTAVLAGVFLIPKLDPLKKNLADFRNYLDIFIIILGLFLLYIYCLSLLYNLGMQLNIVQFMAPMMGILFFYTGVMLKHTRPNWFIGIRTPWTLSSEIVWNKTHELGGTLFKISGILTVLGTFFPEIAIWLILIPIIASAAITIVYSYFQFQEQKTVSNAKRN